MKKIMIGDRTVGDGAPVYIIAEIGSNFDGSIDRAKQLIDLAKESGADAVKFQSFKPGSIISKDDFTEKKSFQSKWDKPVFEVYKNAMLPREWHSELNAYSRKKGIPFFSAPYDKEAVDLLLELDVPAFKIGSGDITFLELLEYIALKKKPVILSTGASTLEEITEAVEVIKKTGNNELILLQCITNYPSPIEQANLRAMVALKEKFNVPVGYSDHSPGSLVPLGAVALGACIIEKHFTDDKTRKGPDHPFAMDSKEFSEMASGIRQMEKAMGKAEKIVVPAESETVILQRRSLHTAVPIKKGQAITKEMIEVLRPAKGLPPKEISKVVGKKASQDIEKGVPLTWNLLS